MQIQGKIYSVGETQVINDKFQKREAIIATADNPEYVQHLKIEATQDRVKIFDGLEEGEDVTVHINLSGRLWTNKEGVETAFNSIVAWKVDKGSNQTESYEGGEEGDSLPF